MPRQSSQRLERSWRFVAFLTFLLMISVHAQAQADAKGQPKLNCTSGPLNRNYGKTRWYVYGCDDGHSIVVVTASGSPALPFYFFFVWGPKGFDLHGEGTGSKKLTDAAFEDLKTLTDTAVQRLHDAAVALDGGT
jgi:hypothetical protein